ncbi:MAG: hypothetical protein V2J26_00895 [Pacificimonas sp.]|jgi:hypothetical protein|nr:hypothetical protein [Pacificimonas sp.]
MRSTRARRIEIAARRYLAKALGKTPVHILHIGKTGGTPIDPVEAHRTPDDMDTRLTPAARANILNWYADDYALVMAIDALRQKRGRA